MSFRVTVVEKLLYVELQKKFLKDLQNTVIILRLILIILPQKKKTASQLNKKYRALQYTTLAGEYVAITTPFVIMGVVNRDEWFPPETGWKTGFGFTLACLLLSIIITSITFDSEKLNNRKGKYIKLLIGCVISAIIFYLLRDIMNEIGNILIFASMGIAGALGLDISSAEFKSRADMYKGAIQRAKEKKVENDVYNDLENGVKF